MKGKVKLGVSMATCGKQVRIWKKMRQIIWNYQDSFMQRLKKTMEITVETTCNVAEVWIWYLLSKSRVLLLHWTAQQLKLISDA
jgi:hypothetical protein